MTTIIRRAIACAIVASLFGFLTARSNGAESPKSVKGSTVYSYPEDQVVLTNQTAYFTVVAEPAYKIGNPGTLTYQWLKNGKKMSGQTRATLVITNAQVA